MASGGGSSVLAEAEQLLSSFSRLQAKYGRTGRTGSSASHSPPTRTPPKSDERRERTERKQAQARERERARAAPAHSPPVYSPARTPLKESNLVARTPPRLPVGERLPRVMINTADSSVAASASSVLVPRPASPPLNQRKKLASAQGVRPVPEPVPEQKARRTTAVVEAAAATRIQAAWRGFRARALDVRIASARREIRTRRAEAHILWLEAEVERLNRRVSEEEELRSLQQEALKALWSQLQETRHLALADRLQRRERAARVIQRTWRGFCVRRAYSAALKRRLNSTLSPSQQLRAKIASGSKDALVRLCLQLHTQVGGLQDAVARLSSAGAWGGVAASAASHSRAPASGRAPPPARQEPAAYRADAHGGAGYRGSTAAGRRATPEADNVGGPRAAEGAGRAANYAVSWTSSALASSSGGSTLKSVSAAAPGYGYSGDARDSSISLQSALSLSALAVDPPDMSAANVMHL